MRVYLLAGGGTAGHVNPLLAVADRIRRDDPNSTILVLGTAEGLEARLVPARGYQLLVVEALPFPRRPNRYAFGFPRRLRRAVDVVQSLIRTHGVDVVVGFGGYASAPAYLAARREGIPIAIHEANVRPGLANRLGARFTDFVGVAFRATRIHAATWVGMPLRLEIEQLDRFALRSEALRFFGLVDSQPILLVSGGSSGARRINETVADSITTILGLGWQVIHLTGAYRESTPDRKLPGYVVLKYCDRMELALAVTDLSLGRAGTSTVAELTALGIPAVFVPYPSGNGEQRLNCREAEQAGGAIVVSDREFTPAWVSRELVPVLQKRAMIAMMAARISTVGVRDGTDQMVALVTRALSAK